MSWDSDSSIDQQIDGIQFDVAILGGGLAGQGLARQIRRELPELSVAVLDKLARPLPEAAFKVGEATVEMGAHYLASALGLEEYLKERHLLKMGLRYFLGDANGPLEHRPEMGLTEPPAFDSYLIDRGRLENDLRAMNQAKGVVVLEGATVDDVEFAADGGRHVVSYRSGRGGHIESLSARWVVDATGRRRFLQRKFGLGETEDTHCSAAWFRVEGRVDVEDLVAREKTEWHARVPQGLRHRAVVHLLGDGYWVWIIALPSGSTSIGIDTDERIHPLSAYGTKEKALNWLALHEPVLADHLKQFPMLDFRVMKKYTYSSQRVFSMERWSCVGEAAVFADPFYAPGIDMIGVGNNITIEMIRREMEGRLASSDVDAWSRWFITFNHALAENIQGGYPYFGHTTPASAKLLWDFAAAWGYEAPQVLNRTYLDREASTPIRAVTAKFVFLQIRMQRLFADWAAKPPGRASFRFIDYFTLRYLLDLRDRNLQAGKSTEELIRDAEANMALIEELAQALFLVAVADQYPEQLDRFEDPVWLNVWAIGLDPSHWDADKLFEPRSERRDPSWIRDDLFTALGL